jgi:hypothetical protein
MSDKETEEGALVAPVDSSSNKQHGLFGAAGIELSELELSSSATTKFLRHLNTIQESEIGKLRSYETQYYDKRQECEVVKMEKAILERELKSKKEMENLQKVMISVGGIILGTLKLLEGQPGYVVAVLAVLSVLLIAGGMFPILRIGAAK